MRPSSDLNVDGLVCSRSLACMVLCQSTVRDTSRVEADTQSLQIKTFQAAAQAIIAVVAEGRALRACLADTKGTLDWKDR